MKESLDATAVASAAIVMGGGHTEQAEAHGRYVVECFDAEGNLKWTEEIENLVTTVGKNLALDTVLAGSAYTASVKIGLKGTGSANVADTMASHGGWSEVGGANAPAYSGNRPTPSFSAASAGSKATSAAASFTFTSGGTVAGCFLVLAGSATKDDTTGTLYSAGDFGASRTVVTSDVLNVTYTASL